MHDKKVDLASKLHKLTADYLQRLPVVLDEIATLADLKTVSKNLPATRQRLEKLHQLLHKLAGTSGTFGLYPLSQQAIALDKSVQTLLESVDNETDEAHEQALLLAVSTLFDIFKQTKDRHSRSENTLAVKKVDTASPLKKRTHVWLVEDDPQLGQSLVQLLNQFDYETHLYTQSAIRIAAPPREPRPDILMMDVLLTDETIEYTTQLFSSPALQALDCPILIISSRDDFQSRARAARLGAACFMLKPLDVSLLVNRIEAMLAERFAVPYRILIIDDDADLANHFRLVLSAANMEVLVLNKPETLIDVISGFHPEMILMDMHMPGYSGPELATIIRHHTEWIGLPIVYLSAETDIAQQLQAMQRGADDFITKPISDAYLISAVKIRAARSRQLAELASKDSLTGMLKHALIKESLALELARAQRNRKPLSIAMIDIDLFKGVNDTYGHAVGDRVIVALAHLLKHRLRKTDIVGRYGGEEFVAILPECDFKTAVRLIDDIRERFSTLSFQHEEKEFNITLSAGIASDLLQPMANSNELLIAADEALYVAKHNGRNQVQVADNSQLPQKIKLESPS
ncbi:MAG: diguanylate cyclase [Rhodocyclales bacterium]|nr:diguanylate cyclase [Rhodocyclales bacterium]